MFTKCAIDGIDSPCCDDVGDINAPVAQNKIFLISPFLILFSISEHKTLAEQPHPEPPE